MNEDSRADAGDAVERAEQVWRDSRPVAADFRTRTSSPARGRVGTFVRDHWPYLFLPAILVIILFVAALFYVRVAHRATPSATPFQYRTQ